MKLNESLETELANRVNGLEGLDSNSTVFRRRRRCAYVENSIPEYSYVDPLPVLVVAQSRLVLVVAPLIKGLT